MKILGWNIIFIWVDCEFANNKSYFPYSSSKLLFLCVTEQLISYLVAFISTTLKTLKPN